MTAFEISNFNFFSCGVSTSASKISPNVDFAFFLNLSRFGRRFLSNTIELMGNKAFESLGCRGDLFSPNYFNGWKLNGIN